MQSSVSRNQEKPQNSLTHRVCGVSFIFGIQIRNVTDLHEGGQIFITHQEIQYPHNVDLQLAEKDAWKLESIYLAQVDASELRGGANVLVDCRVENG